MTQFYPISAQIPQRQFPFGADFFKRKFPDYIRNYCSLEAKTTVLEFVLGDGLTMDVSHIEEIDNDYLLAVAFVDSHECKDTFRSYVRYDTIVRINIEMIESNKRPVGFSVHREPRDTTNGEPS